MALKLKNIKQALGEHYGQVASPNERPRPDLITVVDQSITVGQMYRGSGSLTKWMNAIRAAETVLNPRREELYNLYNDIKIDTHVDMLMGKRTGAVLNADSVWNGIDPDTDLWKHLNEPWFWKLKGLIMQSRAWGCTLVEVKPGPNGRFTDVEALPYQNTRPEVGAITKRAYGSLEDAIFYEYGEYPKYIFRVGDKKNLGYLLHLVPYVLMKRDNLSFFAIHNELFGSPFRIYYYDPNQPDTRKKVTEQAEAAGHAAYIVLPKGSEVDYKTSNSTGSRDVFESLHKICNEEMTLNVLRQSLTTSSGDKGSYSLGKVHKDVEQSLNFEDMYFTEMVINYAFRPVAMAHGYPLQQAMFGFNEIERLGMEQKVKVVAEVAKYAPVAYEYWWDTFGIPHPDDQTILRFESLRKPIVDSAEETDPVVTEEEKKKTTLSYKLSAHFGAGWFGSKGKIVLAAEPPMPPALTAAIEAAAAAIYNSELKPGYYDEEVVRQSAALLYKGVEQGYGQSLAGLAAVEPDAVMLTALKRNVYEFAVWKNYHFVGAASDLLIDQSGAIRSLQDFMALVRPQLSATYYDRWIAAEYQVAVARAQAARQWQDIASRPEPVMLRFRAVKDERTRASHRSIDGLTRLSTDPIWDKYWPPLDYGCRCTVAVTQSTEATSTFNGELVEPAPGFRNNPGKSREIFGPDHPYREQSYGPASSYDAFIQSEINKP